MALSLKAAPIVSTLYCIALPPTLLASLYPEAVASPTPQLKICNVSILILLGAHLVLSHALEKKAPHSGSNLVQNHTDHQFFWVEYACILCMLSQTDHRMKRYSVEAANQQLDPISRGYLAYDTLWAAVSHRYSIQKCHLTSFQQTPSTDTKPIRLWVLLFRIARTSPTDPESF